MFVCYVYDLLSISDIRRMNEQALYAANTGMIILGGGLMKHHICNANLMVIILHIIVYFIVILHTTSNIAVKSVMFHMDYSNCSVNVWYEKL